MVRRRGAFAAVVAVSALVAVACLPGPVQRTVSIGAGTGVAGFDGDGGPAVAAMLNRPEHIDIDADGNVYVPDEQNHRVRRIDPAGMITTVAGNGSNSGGTNVAGPATEASVPYPQAVAVGIDGDFYVASFGYVFRVDSGGVISHVAGSGGSGGPTGDGGPATQARLGLVGDLTVDDQGNLYISSESAFQIRKVDGAGVIDTVAGTGVRGFSGDGGPATDARIDIASGLDVNAVGDLYLADSWNHRVRRVDGTTGVITTVAGSGATGFSAGGFGGDGGLATEARLHAPSDVILDPDGSFLILDSVNARVRLVSDGVITTAFGGGTTPVGAAPVAVEEVALGGAQSMSRAPNGDIWLSRFWDHQVLRIWRGGGALGGKVTDSAGQAVGNTTVVLYRADARSTPVASTTTTDNGRYSFPVMPGEYVVQFTGDAQHAGEWWDDAADGATATPVTIGSGDQTVVNATLAPT